MLRVYDGAMPAKRPTPTTFDGWLGSVIEGLIGPLGGRRLRQQKSAPPLAVGQGRGVVVLERQRGTLGVVTPGPKPPELTQ